MTSEFAGVGEKLIVERVVYRAPLYAEVVDVQASVTRRGDQDDLMTGRRRCKDTPD